MSVLQQTHPYTENKNEYVSNIKDQLTQLSASDKYDPFAKWSWLGERYPQGKSSSSLTSVPWFRLCLLIFYVDGMVAWMTLGVNLSDHSIEQIKPNNGKRGFRFLDDHLEH
jgi:hypothetical protein